MSKGDMAVISLKGYKRTIMSRKDDITLHVYISNTMTYCYTSTIKPRQEKFFCWIDTISQTVVACKIKRENQLVTCFLYLPTCTDSFMWELVNASSFLSLLILITGNMCCVCDMQKTLPIGSFIWFFPCFTLR